MAQTLIDLYDAGANSYFPVPSDLCREDFDGNLFFHVDGITGDTNLNGFLSHPAFVNAVDNMDGTWTFEMNPDLLATGECITLYEETPTPCVDDCPEVTFRQGVNGDGDLVAIIAVNHDDLASVEVNGNLYTTNWVTETTAPTGSCVIYVFEIISNAGCTWNFTITLPACEWYGAFDDCLDHNECTSFAPSLTYACDNATGIVTVTTNDDGGTIVTESLWWSCTGMDGTWIAVVGSAFTPTCEEGFIKWVVELDDACPEFEIIEPFLCPLDCENTSECACEYDAGADTFTINCTDTFASGIATETLVYYIDGGAIPHVFAIGVPIPATGITRIDWFRTVEFVDSCPDLELTDYCTKVDECDYTGFDVTCEFNDAEMYGTPTFVGDETILTRSEKHYSVDGGATWSPYFGGSIHTGLFVIFRWVIQVADCEPETKISACGNCDKCDDLNVTINNDIDNPIYVAIPECVYVADCIDQPIACQQACFDFSETPNLTNLTTEAGANLNADPAFNFPYSSAQYLNFLSDLLAYLATNGGGTVWADRNNDTEIFCIQIRDASLDLGTLVTDAPETVVWGDCDPCDDTCEVTHNWTQYQLDSDSYIELGEMTWSSPMAGQLVFNFTGAPNPLTAAADFKTAWDTELAKSCDFLEMQFIEETPQLVLNIFAPRGSITSVVDNLDNTVTVNYDDTVEGYLSDCCEDNWNALRFSAPVFANVLTYTETLNFGSWANPVIFRFNCINVTDLCCDYVETT